MKGYCGALCTGCTYLENKKCNGCIKSRGCPFGKKCFIANYISIGGLDSYEELKRKLIDEINSLDIEGMSKIDSLNPLNGNLVNLDYLLPNGKKVKYLDDLEVYLGTQVESVFNDEDNKRYFGVVANMSFILVSTYEEDFKNPELLLYKKR